jgi:S-disulfanyl-L-cysteine oxidoreductase SoxD
MIPFLSDRSIAWILAALPAVGLAQRSLASQWDGVYTVAQADRGRFAYERYCAGCHGVDLRGADRITFYPGQVARTPPLAGETFNRNWDGRSLGDLFDRIRVSMPEQNPGSLRPETIADIVALMLQQGRYPAGSAELSPVRGELDGITFWKDKR